MTTRKGYETWVVILGSLVAGAVYTWLAGEDANWDWRNYHEYSAYAWIHGRFDLDVAPAGIQSFFNPLPYLPAYLLRHHLDAPFSGLVLGAVQGLNLALIYWIARQLLGSATSAITLAACIVIAAFGPMTLSEVGTSFADILIALPVIAGLALTISANAQHRARYVIAGILIGGAVGLKLTNMVFCIGAAASLLLAARPLIAFPYFALGAAIGGLVAGGEWCWTLWREFGNPVFPFYNSIFRSSEVAAAANADLRFLPRGLWEALAYPFYWMVGDHPSSEGPFRDPRFALFFVLLAVSAVAGLVSKTRVFSRRDKQFLVFFLVAYETWLLEFSIHRYAIVLELLAAPAIVLLMARLLRALQHDKARIRRLAYINAAAAITTLAIACWSQPADWTRRPWSDPFRPVVPRALLQPATFVLIEKPLGYVVPLLSPKSRAYQIADIVMPVVPGGLLDRRIRAGLADPLPGGVWALHLQGSPPRQNLLDEYGLRFDSNRTCELIGGADYVNVEACPLVTTK